jgi:ribonuclease HII
MSKSYTTLELISDDEDDSIFIKLNNNDNDNEKNEIKIKKTRTRTPQTILKTCLQSDVNIFEIGVDEAGRGPLFGRVYAGAVVLPKDNLLFQHNLMKDSKKFGKSKKGQREIYEAYEYIKQNAIAWATAYETEETIDSINILQATQTAMHKAIKSVIEQLEKKKRINANELHLLIDGNYFKPYSYQNHEQKFPTTIKFDTVEQGDNTYSSIAAASILAKVERDKYIDELCAENPDLCEKYGIDSNKGYGAKKHRDGIAEYGITKWHRKTFGICSQYK